MELIGALAAGVAVAALLLALAPARAQPRLGLRERVRAWSLARTGRARSSLAQARLDVSPRTYLALEIASPLVLGWLGLLLSVPLAVIGLVTGAFVPRWYVRYLVASEARAAADDAPRVLRAMVNRAASGGTYPDLYAAAAEAARHRWVKADFEEILGRYYAAEAPADALIEVRRRQAGRNLALVYDALITLARTHQPVSAAAQVLGSLGDAARANASIAKAAIAESKGLRLQATILAVVIPAMFVYLALANGALIAPVLSTPLGRYVLLPAAALLEITGIALSWRITRLEA
jgi:Flp pilus assembly protein TadB